MLDWILSSTLPRGLFNLYTQTFPPSPTWTDADIPDLTDKTIIVTGASSGIGKDTARALLHHNADVYIGGRNKSKIESVIDELRNETGKTAQPFLVDLSDFDSVNNAAHEFLHKETQLAALFCNAGIMAAPVELLSKQGYDIQFQTNVMSHYLLATLLHPALDNYSKNNYRNEKARVVHTSSAMQSFFIHETGIDFHLLKDGHLRRSTNINTWDLYGYSKIGNTVISNILNKQQVNVSHSSCHPGILQTELWRHTRIPGWKAFFSSFILYPSSLGSLTQLYLGTVEKDTEGLYGIPWARHGIADKRTSDPSLNKDLEEWLQTELAGYLPQ
ncbi:hypothetical protein J056_004177 [Wallemia ichthyophaga EXF-994]|uniref:NAD(P)-binding protein n=1 Tax=Wallemia ichthyophaga (strain EXF-994 / CBS 113033) TaxID=1299270 RepID=R9AMR7_WALI9|nr:uncharacterized protein J056_004177 [Wallemia ichthyophaga EXF-994]EOR01391.1 hypothetical protein J056_004177 [Wallemia ichthyophaga EXF-994]TIB35380.1 hypothetical protein E3P84_01403 [Wallemia ichthyophaga]TIB42212.1 hypothetical protein E3P83_01352 [Wallemia ichthyophaga]